MLFPQDVPGFAPVAGTDARVERTGSGLALIRAAGCYDATTPATRNVSPGIARRTRQVMAIGRSPWCST